MRGWKKGLLLLLGIAVIFCVTACGGEREDSGKSQDGKKATEAPTGKPTEEPGEPSVPTGTYSTGLQYLDNGDGTCEISGIGTCEDKHIIIPETLGDGLVVSEIADGAFSYNLSIERVTFPSGLKTIGKKAFDSCKNLKTVDFPDGLDRISESAFARSGLVSADLPDSVTTVQAYAFAYCAELKTVHFPAGENGVSGWMFDHCTKLESIELPEGIRQISANAFDSCESLKTLVLPNSVESILDSAFQHSGLTKLTLSVNLSEIENLALTRLPSLKEIVVPEGNRHYSVTGNCLIDNRTNTAIAVWGSRSLPTDGSVAEIGSFLFQGDESLKEVVIPDGVTGIAVGAYQDCKNLTRVTFPQSLTKISVSAFRGTGLTELTIPDSVNAVQTSAFAETALKKVTVGNGVTGKLSETFKDCTKLEEAVIGNGDLSLLGTFTGCAKLTKLTLGEGIGVIGSNTFNGCRSLKEITYTGTTEQWEAITKNDGWNDECPLATVHCADGDVAVSP